MSTDPGVLTGRAYASLGPLAARAAIYRYQRDRVDLPGLVVERLSGRRGPVLDIGAGLGTYSRRLRDQCPDLAVVALDLSPGMRPDVVADIQRLPVADETASAVLAMHMLYHVPDLTGAVRELRRVLVRGGVALISTNGPEDKREIGDLESAAVHDLTGQQWQCTRPAARFTLDDQALLAEAFARVEQVDFARETVVPDPEPLVDFVDSLRAFTEPVLPGGVDWPSFMGAAERRIRAEIAQSGAFRFRSRVGLFACS